MNADDLLHEFLDHWRKKEDRGQVSGMGVLERYAVLIFAEWLLRRYKVTPKAAKGKRR